MKRLLFFFFSFFTFFSTIKIVHACDLSSFEIETTAETHFWEVIDSIDELLAKSSVESPPTRELFEKYLEERGSLLLTSTVSKTNLFGKVKNLEPREKRPRILSKRPYEIVLPFKKFSKSDYKTGQPEAWRQFLITLIFVSEKLIIDQAPRKSLRPFFNSHLRYPFEHKELLISSAERIYGLLTFLEQEFPETDWTSHIELASNSHWRHRQLGLLWDTAWMLKPFFNPAESFRFNKKDLVKFQNHSLRQGISAFSPLYRGMLYLYGKRIKQIGIACFLGSAICLGGSAYEWVQSGKIAEMREEADNLKNKVVGFDGSGQITYDQKIEADPNLVQTFKPELDKLEKQLKLPKNFSQQKDIEEKIKALKKLWFSLEPKGFQKNYTEETGLTTYL